MAGIFFEVSTRGTSGGFLVIKKTVWRGNAFIYKSYPEIPGAQYKPV